MIRKTQGIVLHTLPFQDSAVIACVYTALYGRQDFLVRGVRSARKTANPRQAQFQPAHILELVYYDKAGRELQYVNESSFAHLYSQMNQHPVRSLYAMLVLEVFYRAVREHEPNPALYDKLRQVLMAIDTAQAGLYDISLQFLWQMTQDLGFYPLVTGVDEKVAIAFDLQEGTLHNVAVADDPLARALFHLLQANGSKVPRALRQDFLQLVLRYYQLHLDHFRMPQSLQVYAQVFTE